MKKPLVMGFVLLAIILVSSNIVQSLDKSEVIREFSSLSVDSDDVITITLGISIINNKTYYVIEEYIPSGWTIVDDGGGATADSQKLVWVVIENAVNTTYSYTIQAPSSTGNYVFSGVYMFEDFNNSATTLGDTQISVTTSNPNSEGGGSSSGGGNSGGGGSSGGGSSSSIGSSKGISLISAQTDVTNDIINLNESQEEINSEITGAVIGLGNKLGKAKSIIGIVFIIGIIGAFVFMRIHKSKDK